METFSALLAICAGNSRARVNSPHKGQWRGALMFSLICIRINGWVNNGEAGDLRRHRAHYDVTVMSRVNYSQLGHQTVTRAPLNIKMSSHHIGNPILEIIRSYDRLISTDFLYDILYQNRGSEPTTIQTIYMAALLLCVDLDNGRARGPHLWCISVWQYGRSCYLFLPLNIPAYLIRWDNHHSLSTTIPTTTISTSISISITLMTMMRRTMIYNDKFRNNGHGKIIKLLCQPCKLSHNTYAYLPN